MMFDAEICVEYRENAAYPTNNELYRPSVRYPEYPFDEISSEPNNVYDMIRSGFIRMGLDSENIGKPTWNPLKEYVHPGDVVVIKPNMVRDCETLEQYNCTLTHPSVFCAAIDYCVCAKAGRIILGDAPIQGADMDRIKDALGIDLIIAYYKRKGVNIEFSDFRDLVVKTVNHVIVTQKEKNIDSKEFITVKLGKHSKHYNPAFGGKYESCGYVDDAINTFHKGARHDYVIARQVMEADAIINLPKPKTHRFAGITGAQKNIVGTCSDKESLPHYKAGSCCVGGDETDNAGLLSRLLADIYRKYLWAGKRNQRKKALLYFYIYVALLILKGNRFYVHGAWYGNDTIWRTIIDLNKIMLYADKNGIYSEENGIQRRIFTIGDMIISGEKEGPLKPSPKQTNMVMMSNNLAIFDYVFCKIAGFDESLIPAVYHSIRNSKLCKEGWEEVRILSNSEKLNNKMLSELNRDEMWNFQPHPFWKKVFEEKK